MMRRWKGRCIHLDHRCPVPSVESLIGQRFDCELKRKGVTLFLLWEEYKSTHPNGFQYSWFCQHYRAYAGKLDLVMRQTHRAGETMFVDYAGQTVPVVNRDTGELREAQIFVAVLGASSYTFARASWTQSLPDWIDAHCRAFTFFGGVTDTLVPDNLKAGVTHPHRHQTFFSLDELNRAIAELLVSLNERTFGGAGQTIPHRALPDSDAERDQMLAFAGARAGKPRSPARSSSSSGVYPRSCGETRQIRVPGVFIEGLSPLVRGNRPAQNAAGSLYRSIPARAGKPGTDGSGSGEIKVYPRSCGETISANDNRTLNCGLSPLVRGNRVRRFPRLAPRGSIPARAGKPDSLRSSGTVLKVYPRSCGETRFVEIERDCSKGLSPLVRGNPVKSTLASVFLRSIPARAGKPQTESLPRSRQRVYPRSCGETHTRLR